MIETSLLVNDYPEPPEDKTKKIIFTCNCEVEITVYAEDEETAKEYCNITDCDDYEVKEIVDIINCKVEDQKVEEKKEGKIKWKNNKKH